MSVFVCKLHKIGMCNLRVYYVLSQTMVCYDILKAMISYTFHLKWYKWQLHSW